MSYDIHIVRTKDWLDAATEPISKADVDALVAVDPELEWSATDYVDMNDGDNGIIRYYMISWIDNPCFWWYRDQIMCSSPEEIQVTKAVEIAKALGAFVVGDDGEIYS